MNGIAYVLYCLPEVLEAIALGKVILICEGEKDADALRDRGYTATTNIAGALKWRPEYTAQLTGAERVILFPHNDLVGREHMGKVANELGGAGISVAYRRQCEREATGGEPVGWQRWRRQLLEQTRDQVIVFAQGGYGIFHLAEHSLLLGIKLKDTPPGIGTRSEVLAKYRLIART